MEEYERLAGPRAITFGLIGGTVCWVLIGAMVRLVARYLG